MIDWRRFVRERLPHLDTRPERENEIVEELSLQLEATYEHALARGASPEDARQQAMAEVPDWAVLARTVAQIETPLPVLREAPRGALFAGSLHDVRLAARSLLRTPSYSAVGVVTLALGLGLATAAFSILDALLIRPLPYASPERLVLVKATVPPEGRETVEITLPDAADLAAESRVFESLAAVQPFAGTTTTTDPPSRIEGFEVSTSLFDVLAIAPVLGRSFVGPDASGAPPAVMLGHGYWQRLGSPADIVGRTLIVNEVPRTIIGVAPDALRIELLPHPADVFVPIAEAHPFNTRAIRAFRVMARLREGVRREEAGAVAATVGARLAAAYPETNLGRTFTVAPLQDEIVGSVRGYVWLIAGLVLLVLLVAAVNFASLLLARTVGRLREVTVRLALGAGRWQLARESLSEGVILACGGAAGGAVIARALLAWLQATPGLVLPRLSEVALDWRALSALSIMALAIAAVVAIMPLWLLRRRQALGALRTGHETAGRPALRLRSALVVGQTSFAFVLLAAAAVAAVGLRAVLAQPLGFETASVVTLRVSVPDVRYPTRDATIPFFTGLLQDLRTDSAVQAAGLVSTLPLAGNTGSTLTIQGREDVPIAMRPTVGWQWTSPGYFDAIGIPLLSGRDFTSEDITRTPHVTVVNETLARLHFNGEDPIGKRVYFGGVGPNGPSEWHEVIGVVGDVRHRSLEAAPDARAYDLFGQHWGRTVSLAVRTSESPLHVAGVVRHLLAARDPRLAVFSVRTTSDLVSGAVATRRILLWLVSGLALVSLAIALVGLYGTLSYMVAQRTREVGVRVALGATGGQIRRLVIGHGLRMVAAGLLLGLLCAIVARRLVTTQLVGIGTIDTTALAIAAAALLAAALLACLAPAARALRVNPIDALRAE